MKESKHSWLPFSVAHVYYKFSWIDLRHRQIGICKVNFRSQTSHHSRYLALNHVHISFKIQAYTVLKFCTSSNTYYQKITLLFKFGFYGGGAGGPNAVLNNLVINPSTIAVSGFSSGAMMATQIHVAFSKSVACISV